MKKRKYTALVPALACLAMLGCAQSNPSSGFHIGSHAKPLPPGVPQRVGVVLFEGEEEIGQQATDQFTTGLLECGFDVIERNNLQTIIDELKISHSDLFSESSRAAFGKQLGLDALFTGSVSGDPGILWVDTYANIKLVDIETGRILWAVSAKDPRLFTARRKSQGNMETSISHTVREALKHLKKDLEKIRDKNQ